MLLHDSRREARADADGNLILLEDQDRSRWNRAQIAEGLSLVNEALREAPGPYTLQAAISAVHAEAASAEATDWNRIVMLYDELARLNPSPVAALNRAVAVAMRDGPAAGLALIDALLGAGELTTYSPAHIARAALLGKLGRSSDAVAAYASALELTDQEPQRRHIERSIAALRNAEFISPASPSALRA
jgi:RNA polymerase sigma-70 factor (ECF subfamily)